MRDPSRRGDVVYVALLSPFRLLCDALRSALAKDRRIRVLSHAASVNEIARACKEDADLIVVCDGSSSDALRFIQAASRRLSRCRKVVVIGLHKTQKYLRVFAGIGVRGLVARDASLGEPHPRHKIREPRGRVRLPITWR